MSQLEQKDTDKSLKVFAKILAFVNDLKQVFPKENIVLYHKLLKKTPIGNPDALQKHIHVFDTFVESNRQAIVDKKLADLNGDILFSKKVYLDLIACMKEVEKENETLDAIFKHLQVILFLLHPNDTLKQALEPIAHKPGDPKPAGEDKFLENFMNKIEENFRGQEFNNPMEAVGKMLSTGIFSEMMTSMNQGISSGEIDMGRLLGSVQGLIGNIGGVQSDPQLNQMMNMASSLMRTMAPNPSGNTNGEGNQTPQ
jgi:hypothetical protein